MVAPLRPTETGPIQPGEPEQREHYDSRDELEDRRSRSDHRRVLEPWRKGCSHLEVVRNEQRREDHKHDDQRKAEDPYGSPSAFVADVTRGHQSNEQTDERNKGDGAQPTHDLESPVLIAELHRPDAHQSVAQRNYEQQCTYEVAGVRQRFVLFHAGSGGEVHVLPERINRLSYA